MHHRPDIRASTDVCPGPDHLPLQLRATPDPLPAAGSRRSARPRSCQHARAGPPPLGFLALMEGQHCLSNGAGRGPPPPHLARSSIRRSSAGLAPAMRVPAGIGEIQVEVGPGHTWPLPLDGLSELASPLGAPPAPAASLPPASGTFGWPRTQTRSVLEAPNPLLCRRRGDRLPASGQVGSSSYGQGVPARRSCQSKHCVTHRSTVQNEPRSVTLTSPPEL
jgi:hypothetical protein